jgi:hypothetical protein
MKKESVMKDLDDIPQVMAELGQAARAASAELAFAAPEVKTKALNAAADAIWAKRAEIIAANEKDMAFGADKGLSPAMMDRLKLTEDRIADIRDGLKLVAAQKDPVRSGPPCWWTVTPVPCVGTGCKAWPTMWPTCGRRGVTWFWCRRAPSPWGAAFWGWGKVCCRWNRRRPPPRPARSGWPPPMRTRLAVMA